MSLSGKQIGWIIAGLVVIGIGYYVGFVGWTDTQMTTGPQGYGLYEVTTTYPIAGIVIMVAGLGAIGNAFGGDDDSADEIEQPVEDTDAGGQPADTGGTEPAAADETRYCTSCGAEIAADATFCTECGESLGAESAAAGG